MAESFIEVEVVFAAVDRQLLLKVSVPVGTTLREAVRMSGMAGQFPQWNLDECPVGIFGRVVAEPQAHVVQAGERIELYRPLLVDPKEVRKLRAAKAAKAKAAKL
ncbi:RnfH family protein [Pseudomonas sp. LS1212]|uniref:RnfH family protein n=1 Tax=Pseudomonas sp. LS1212 TaxID=2972478 RepID=UPI00215C9BDC|nr:RnfH family protein [Pseudomonas sp. LS1212]UVJ44718.1 RnfH family protein [Pseudomonas sp. LS1212]